MFWDIALPVLAAIAQGLTGFLGWRVTVHGAGTERQKRTYEWLFGCATIVGILAVGIAAYRGTAISRDLEALRQGQQQTNRGIQQIQNTPPTVVVNPPTVNVGAPHAAAQVREEKFSSSYLETANGALTGRSIGLVLGKPVMLNVYFVNDGSAAADRVRGFGRIYLVVDNSEQTDKDVVLKFKQAVNSIKWDAIGSIFPGGRDYYWFTAQSERPIIQDDLDKLKNGTEVLYFLTSVSWNDPTGSHYLHRCRRLQSPAFDPEVWQFCRHFQDHR